MKKAAIAIISLVVVTIGFFVASYVLPALPAFYYAEFNRTFDQLSSIPGVKVIDNWQHQDITLEDCGFTVRVNDSEPVRIDFYDGESWSLPFKRIDGIIVSYPYNPKNNDYEQISFSAQELRNHGVDSSNLGTVLQDIEKVLDFAHPRQMSCISDRDPGVWVIIFRDLDRYKKGEQAGADQPTTARGSKPEDNQNPQPVSEDRPQ